MRRSQVLDGRATRACLAACLSAVALAALPACSGSSAPAAAPTSAAGTSSPSSQGSSAPGSPVPSAAASAATRAATGSSAPPTDTASPSVAVTTPPAVRIGTAASLVGNVVVSVGKVRTAALAAQGPGEIAGPGLVVPVTVKNTSAKRFDLSGLVVNAAYGDGTPAVPSDAAPAKPLPASVAAGGTVTGLYVFRAGSGATTTLRVEVSSDNAQRVLVFRR
jgi:hypothetical protein